MTNLELWRIRTFEQESVDVLVFKAFLFETFRK